MGSNYVGFCTNSGCYSSGDHQFVITSWSNTLITLTIPTQDAVPSGAYSIVVFMWDGKISDPLSSKSNTIAFTITASGPSISGLTGGATYLGPGKYQTIAGGQINIYGSGFSDFIGCSPLGVAIFTQGGSVVSRTMNYRVISANVGVEELTFGTPSSLAPGVYSFYLENGSGINSNSVSITVAGSTGRNTIVENGPQITDISPNPAWEQPAVSVSVSGSGFGPTRGKGSIAFLDPILVGAWPNISCAYPSISATSWSNNQVFFTPPASLPSGTYHVAIVVDPTMACGDTSNFVVLTIKANKPVWGFADLHTHPASNFAFGGDANGMNGIFLGSEGGAYTNYGTMIVDPFDPLSKINDTVAYDHALANDLPACSPTDHDPGDEDPVRNKTRSTIIQMLDLQPSCDLSGCSATIHHGSSGAPLITFGSNLKDVLYYPFQYWPAANSLEHQQMHVTAIRRAYEGGLRLLFASVTNDELLTDLWANGTNLGGNAIPVHDTNFDFHSAITQILAITNLVAANAGWMQLVTTPSEARQAINDNKLAVVLSLELNTLTITQILTLIADFKVRHVIPIHLINNSFGGTAVYSDVFNSENNWINNSFYTVEPDAQLSLQLGAPATLTNSNPNAQSAGTTILEVLSTVVLGGVPIAVPLVNGNLGAIQPTTLSPYQFGQLGYPQSGGERNTLGLSNMVQMVQLMNTHVLLDIAHMGEKSAYQTLELAQQFNYPVMDSHTGLRNDAPGYIPINDTPINLPGYGYRAGLRMTINERSLPFSQAVIIGQLGGVIGLGTSGTTNNPDPVGKWLGDYYGALQEIAAGNGGIFRGVALGTDMNGLSPQIAFDNLPTQYPITVAESSSPPPGQTALMLQACPRNGSSNYNFQHDGIAHYGMLPDFIQALSQRPNSAQAIKALYNSAEDVIEMWEAVVKVPAINMQ